jgi:hypothetical protein
LPIRSNIGSADQHADVAEVRRESKPTAIVNAYLPMPLMTNTGMLADETPRGANEMPPEGRIKLRKAICLIDIEVERAAVTLLGQPEPGSGRAAIP